ncbi:GNAT family N-acetyltransferase [Flavobacterium sp. AG291]|uniref:GNAT family N-acetyltransferase n=1 Tax=Flavobacterium sp. AG291 TaxID=2184000 RepID=UPI001314997D|nr:GNAT family N-acetyltransferase [Flavobacterium sp. AG291]
MHVIKRKNYSTLQIKSEKKYTIIIYDNETDVKELSEFYSAFSSVVTNNLIFDFNGLKEKIAPKFFVVKKHDEIIGFGSVFKLKNYYLDLRRFISPHYRHKGIGEKLLDFIIEDARINNVKIIDGQLNNPDKRTIEFFTSKGFSLNDKNTFMKLNL